MQFLYLFFLCTYLLLQAVYLLLIDLVGLFKNLLISPLHPIELLLLLLHQIDIFLKHRFQVVGLPLEERQLVVHVVQLHILLLG